MHTDTDIQIFYAGTTRGKRWKTTNRQIEQVQKYINKAECIIIETVMVYGWPMAIDSKKTDSV